jgi:D-amino-acid dehydrogenase
MELSGLNYRLDARRVAALTKAVRTYLDGWETTTVQETWTGMRPLTPDGLPVIGALPSVENVVVASGHAMLGVTLGPATGEVVADLVTQSACPEMPAAFSPARFR